MTTRWVDLVDSMSVPKTPERTAEEIVEDVIAAAGLEVVNGWEPA